MAGSCEYGDEPSGSIKCGEFLEWLWTFFSFSGRTLLHGVQVSKWYDLGEKRRMMRCYEMQKTAFV